MPKQLDIGSLNAAEPIDRPVHCQDKFHTQLCLGAYLLLRRKDEVLWVHSRSPSEMWTSDCWSPCNEYVGQGIEVPIHRPLASSFSSHLCMPLIGRKVLFPVPKQQFVAHIAGFQGSVFIQTSITTFTCFNILATCFNLWVPVIIVHPSMIFDPINEIHVAVASLHLINHSLVLPCISGILHTLKDPLCIGSTWWALLPSVTHCAFAGTSLCRQKKSGPLFWPQIAPLGWGTCNSRPLLRLHQLVVKLLMQTKVVTCDSSVTLQ